MNWTTELFLSAHVVLAAILGALIGIERERHVGLAGIRTHAAVAIGACLFGFISFQIGSQEGISPPHTADPSRIAAQIVSGIGFLGAGVILRDKGHIKGLTTAASLWATASIGLAVASKMYILSIVSTLLILALLSLYRLPGWYSWRSKRGSHHYFED